MHCRTSYGLKTLFLLGVRGVDYQDKKESVVLAYNWLQSKVSDVKRFDNINVQKGKKGFQVTENSYRSVAK